MKCEQKPFPIKDLVDAWRSSSLKVNKEYQRGESWNLTQMQGLIDSVFRHYPLPPIFLHKITTPGLEGHQAVRYEVVDGQQRIRSFAYFFDDKFPLLASSDKKLRLPNSLRTLPAPWGTKKYSQLDSDERALISGEKVNAFVITETDNRDEVRDLFIRLQSGTALNRQQVRDAWPGNLGPFIENLAGKLEREPAVALFGLIDRRSDKGDEDRDRFTVNRQVCAQLLTHFLARTKDPLAVQSITADDLDRLYHSNTEFDPVGPSAERFRELLKRTTEIFAQSYTSSGGNAKKNKLKFTKLEVFAVLSLLQDLSAGSQFKFDSALKQTIAERVKNPPQIVKKGKSVSGRAIADYYEQWRRGLPEKLGLHLDAKRSFDEAQRQIIWDRQHGICDICEKPVNESDAEYDHFPVAHYLGGETVVENGRLVHKNCHPRGRPFADADGTEVA